MKKIILPAIFVLALMATTGTAFAKDLKNAGPKRMAEKINWNLSGAVMPVPPYGSLDIPGSDTASKLMVKQPKDGKLLKIKGLMKGLTPNTTYTVYLSNSYTPYKETGWNVSGSYTMDVSYSGSHYNYVLTLSQSGTAITGDLNDTYLPGDPPIINGTITGNTVTFSVDYGSGSWQGVRTFTGTIGASGALSGTWNETGAEQGNDLWSTTAGNAVMTHTGDTGWPGLFTDKVQPLTFITNDKGLGKWKIELKAGDYTGTKFSVWINNGGTLLISDNATIKPELPKPPKPEKPKFDPKPKFEKGDR
jgi:hypothetical protein